MAKTVKGNKGIAKALKITKREESDARNAEHRTLSTLDKIRKVKSFLTRPLAKSRGWQSKRELGRLQKQMDKERSTPKG